ncbi:MAG: NAD(P)H-binding protein [Candidatus Sumerlaeia bacterium]|nr:NAD(P)H-binding protein [Candidatus Sumerlaeia bacterium]
MKVLVAGGTGHTGERLVRRLIRSGHDVSFISRKSDEDPIVAALIRAGATHHDGDFHRCWTAWEALKGMDALVSCAHIRYAGSCVQACRRAGVKRYLQMSSTRRYTKWPCETSREVIRGEAVIVKSGLEYTILRPTMIFGGRRDANITRLVEWFRRHRWFPIFGDGKNLLQPVYVEDLVYAMVSALEKGTSVGKDYTLAGPAPIEYAQFLRETAAAVGVANPFLPKIPRQPVLMASRFLSPLLGSRGLSGEQIQRLGEDKTADINRAISELNFSPHSYRDAINLKARGLAEVEAIYTDV